MNNTKREKLHLVLGGAGFIGTALVRKLLDANRRVRVFARHGALIPNELRDRENLEWFTGDFQNQVDLSKALAGVESVTHLITTAVPESANNDKVYDVTSNIIGTIKLLDLMVALGVKKIVFVSSGGTVYGPSIESPITESHPTNPIVAYGVSKLAIEKYLLLYKQLHGLEPIILRVANAFGEGQPLNRSQGAVGVFFQKALNNDQVEIWGDGSITRDYIYVGDIADALIAALAYEGNENIFNIGMGLGTTLIQLVSQIEDITQRQLRVQFHDARPFDVPTNVLDISRARTALRWEPQTTMLEGLKRVLAQATHTNRR
ncbi:MAG: NAD-dependent epimerase/dehydratase family protein [bacterium]